MQEHLEKFPTHKVNTTEQQVDSELQNIFQNLHETPTNSNLFHKTKFELKYILLKLKFYYFSVDIINDKKETHTQTEVLKDRHCGYMKSKKNLTLHLKQVTRIILIYFKYNDRYKYI